MHKISQQVERKFIDSIDTDEWEILSDSGWHTTSHVHKTIEYRVYALVLDNGYSIECADTHIVFTDNFEEIFVKDLFIGQNVMTDQGPVKVSSITVFDEYENMYDVTVDSQDQRFYSNGILSHNTTCAVAYLLWEAMFKTDQTILVVSNVFAAASEIMERIRYSYELLPDFIKPGVVVYAKTSISFDNGSRIFARATTRNSGRGLSLSILYADELSSVDNNKQNDFYAAIRPTLSTGGKFIVTSTPGSDEDIFAQIWQGATDIFDEYGNERTDGLGRNGFKALKYIWSDHPNRDEQWAIEERAAMGDEVMFAREHECRFVTGDETLINAMTLARLRGKDPEFVQGTVRWYNRPIANRTYIVSLDPSLGTGNDSAAIQVFQLPEMIQTAEWQHNKTDIPGQIKVLREILKYINDCQRASGMNREGEIFWSLENNNIGEAANIVIREIGEDNFAGSYLSQPSKGAAKRRKGYYMSNRTKLEACVRFKTLLEKDKLVIHSKSLISQLKIFIARGASYAAKGSGKDDLVMATLLNIKMLERIMSYDDTINEQFREMADDADSGRNQPFFGIF